MKKIRSIIVITLLAICTYACTADNTVEEGLNSQNMELMATGEDGEATTDDDKDNN